MSAVFIIFFLIHSFQSSGQELNAKVTVNSDAVQISDKKIFEELQTAIEQFLNQRKWTSDKFQLNERIDCNLYVRITSMNVDNFSAELQIQSSRTAYGTAYNSPVFNYLDQEFKFKYARFQPMEYQEGTNINNLTSTLAFYAYIILGLDYDSYALEGGTAHLTKALAIRDVMANEGGWQPNSGKANRNKYFLIGNLMDERYLSFRKGLYTYHRLGIDFFGSDLEKGRESILTALTEIKKVYDLIPNGYVLRLFFNTKTQELINIFSAAKPSVKNKAKELLVEMDPSNKEDYEKL